MEIRRNAIGILIGITTTDHAAFARCQFDVVIAENHRQNIIAAFDAPYAKDMGVVAIDGRMVERMHVDMARRTVAIAEAIEGRV